MTETMRTIPQTNGEAPLPKHQRPKGLLPSSWVGRTLRVAYVDCYGDGQEATAALLDVYPFGALLLQNSDFLNATNATDGDGAALNGEVGRVAGIRILVSNNVPTTGTSPVVSHCQAGHASGLGYAEQIRSVEAIRLEGAFADGIRGLHLYGAKVLDRARLFDLQLNP